MKLLGATNRDLNIAPRTGPASPSSEAEMGIVLDLSSLVGRPLGEPSDGSSKLAMAEGTHRSPESALGVPGGSMRMGSRLPATFSCDTVVVPGRAAGSPSEDRLGRGSGVAEPTAVVSAAAA